METEASNSLEEELAGLTMPSPPRRAGRAKSSRSKSFGGTQQKGSGLLRHSGVAVNRCFSKLEMAERFLEATKGCHQPTTK